MDKAKKKRVKRYLTWGALALVVVILTVMPLMAKNEAEADGPVSSVLSATVEEGSIGAALRGGGTLTANDVEEVTLPSGVKITEFLVKNGQIVTEGTPVATVDKVSVMTAITDVTETLDYLREELEDARDEKVTSSITATAGGRVKKVFAQPGESVQDVMLRDGALAILSLDGLMAVKIERSLDISTGESVLVTLADGEEVAGRVESNLDGVVVITIEDKAYEVGQTVTVTTEDGKQLGQGSLYIHNAWKATAYSGTIENVNAKEERTVSSGATLFTLKDRDFEGELRRRANQHREYEELLQELFQMYESGVLTAPCDGEVSGVDKDSPYLLNATPEGWVVAPLNNVTTNSEEKGWTVMLLGNETPSDSVCTGSEQCTLTWDQHTPDKQITCQALCKYCKTNVYAAGSATAQHASDCITHCTRGQTTAECSAENHYKECIYSCTNGTQEDKCGGTQYHNPSCIEFCKEADGKTIFCNATGDHKLTCIHACKRADTETECPAERYHDVNCIKRCNRSADCPANKHYAICPHYSLTYTATAGIVVRSANGTIEYKYYAGASDVTAYKDANGQFTISGTPNLSLMNTTGFVNSNEKCNPGDIILIVNGTNPSGQTVIANKVYVYQSNAVDMGSLGDMSGLGSFGMGGFGGMDISGMIGGLSGFGNYSAGTVEEEPLFDLEGETLLTVIPHDSATLTISIDEHDIAKVQLGMKATVKVEALKDEEFEAEVTGIALSGTNNGGSSKFAVELTLPMTADMISGMSAAAVLPLEEKQNVTILPAAALVQKGAKTLVYTALDDSGEPANPVEVTTGISDGENVEILSGLEVGQTVYYRYYDTLELDTSAEADRYTFG